MKKFLTVLMVVAVLFTFSFGSAFAAVPWTGETTVKYLTEATDYTAPGAATDGTEGITEAYRAQLTAAVKAAAVTTGYAAPEVAKIKALKATALDEIAAAKTAKAAQDAQAKFAAEYGALKNVAALKAAVPTGATAVIDLTRLNARYGASVTGYYLPGYGTIAYADCGNVTIGTATKFVFTDGSTSPATAVTVQDIIDDPTTYATEQFIIDWLFDNDYRTVNEIAEGVGALVNALVPVTTTYLDTVKAEAYAIQADIYKYADKYDAVDHAKNKLTVADLEGIDALIVKKGDFEEKYAGLAGLGAFTTTDFDNAVKYLAGKYFDVYCAEVSAVPAVSKLTAEDKAKVLDLYAKVNALEDTYEDTWEYVEDLGGATDCPEDYACNYAGLENAYIDFLTKDVAAYAKLDAFTVLKMSGPNAYFDAAEKNVNALKARRAAFDALVADYGYADLNANAVGTMSYALAAAEEAAIIAAEHNMPADADYDAEIEKIDTSKVQAYLNNATVKVTTKALGNRKIRVNAQIDTMSFEHILDEMTDGCTVEYKFYHKAASANTYKAAKVKDRNYITYTKKSLKAGVKYKFQCEVTIKDAKGNVVATKDYKASTIGSRVCR